MRFSRVGLHNLQNLTTAHTCKLVNIYSAGRAPRRIQGNYYGDRTARNIWTQTALLLRDKVCVISYQHLLYVKLLTFYR